MTTYKDLTFKKKIEYIWDYYKLHIILSIIAVIIVSTTIYSSLHSVKYVFNVSLLGNFNSNSSTEIEKFESKITDLVVDKSMQKKQQAFVDTYVLMHSTDKLENLDMSYAQKLNTKAASGDIDILILDKQDFETFKGEGAFAKLDDGKSGIEVDNNKILSNIGFDTTGKVAAIMAKSQNKDKAVEVIKWLTSYN